MAATTVHLVCGGPGAGKTFYSIALADKLHALRITIDEWMQRLFWRDQAPPIDWPLPLTLACEDLILDLTREVVALSLPVVLDLGFMLREQRNRVCGALSQNFRGLLELHILDFTVEKRWRQTVHRNQNKDATFAFHVSREMFDFANAMWQSPSLAEIAECRYQRTTRVSLSGEIVEDLS